MKLYCSKNSCPAGRPENSSIIVLATSRPMAMRSSVRPALSSTFEHVCIVGQALDVEIVVGRRAEQQVLGQRGVHVVLVDVERLDQVRLAFVGQAFAQRFTRAQNGLGQLRIGVRIDRAAQAELINILGHVDHRQNVHRAAIQSRPIGHAGRGVIDPIRARIVDRRRCALGLGYIAVPGFLSASFSGGGAIGRCLRPYSRFSRTVVVNRNGWAPT